MNYCLLWFAHLICGLLLVAAAVAFLSRRRKPKWRVFWPILVSILIFFTFVSTAVSGAFLLKENLQPKWLFGYGLSQAISYIVAAFFLFKWGFKGVGSEEQVARTWPRVRLVLTFFVFLFVYIVTFNFMDMEVQQDLINIRAETTDKIASLIPSNLPEGLNAFPLYEKAAKLLGPRKDLPEWLHESTSPDFNPNDEKVLRLLEKHKGVMKLVRKASTMPGYSQEVDVTNYMEWSIPQYFQYLAFARILNLSARQKASKGELVDAFKDLLSIDSMAGHLRSFPVIISVVVAIRVYEIRTKALEYILGQMGKLPAGLIKLPLNGHSSILGSYNRALSVDGQGSLQALTQAAMTDDILKLATGDVEGKKKETIPTKFWRVFFLPSEIKAAKGIITFWMTKKAKTYSEQRENLKNISNARKKGEMGIFSAIAAPSFSPYLNMAMDCDAKRGLEVLALAVTAYHLANGHYPPSLEALVPEFITAIPPDPFEEDILKMTLVKGGVDLYSAGPTKDSEQGKESGPIHFYLGKGAYQEYRINGS